MIHYMWQVSETLLARRSTPQDSSTIAFLKRAARRSGSLLEMPVALVNMVISGTCVLVDEYDR